MIFSQEFLQLIVAPIVSTSILLRVGSSERFEFGVILVGSGLQISKVYADISV